MADGARDTAKELLVAWRAGDLKARDTLFNLVYRELVQVAAALLRTDRKTSLSSGDLVSETVLRLIALDRIEWQDKAHFLALSARVMRQVLVDQARRRATDRRQHHKVTLISQLGAHGSLELELDQLEKALIRLAAIEPRHAEVVELRFFGNLTLEEVAEVLGMSGSTVKRIWRSSRAWLVSACGPDGNAFVPVEV
ncbi:MAG: ECF-type sigma factor [Hyphomonadaceae bacterium]|nr:ECF-type sigma factor [Hyphomonadaceae bacterium]